MLNRFSKFIHSPYHNQNEKISSLINLLTLSIKKNHTLPSKIELWKNLNFKGNFDDLKFRKLCNDCLDRFENFLTLEQFETVFNNVSYSRGLYGKKPDPDHIEKVLKQLSLWDKKDLTIFSASFSKY